MSSCSNLLAILWSALHERIPNTGQKLQDVFVGKRLLIMFEGDAKGILDETARELSGRPFSGKQHVQMIAAVLDEPFMLDPADAVTMREVDLHAKAGLPLLPSRDPNEVYYVPRIPVDADEAKAMMQLLTIVADMTVPHKNPADANRIYAGYTDDELRRGKPAVLVR